MHPPAAPVPSAPARLRPLVIGMGWLGLALFTVNGLLYDWPFETTNQALLRTFDVVKNCFFALWPLSIWLHLEPRLTGTLQSIINLGLCLVIFPWWLYCGFLVMEEDSAVWQDEQVQYESDNPPVRIVQQYRDVFTTTSTQYRVVKITPLWGPWQHVEPVDPARFPEEHYR